MDTVILVDVLLLAAWIVLVSLGAGDNGVIQCWEESVESFMQRAVHFKLGECE